MAFFKQRPQRAVSMITGSGAATGSIPNRPLSKAPSSGLAKALWEIKKSDKWGYVFALPLIIDFSVFTVYMVFRALTMAFQEVTYGETAWVGLANFQYFIKDPRFWNAIRNSVVYTLTTVPLGIIIALILSELIFRRADRVQVFFKSAYYLPGVVSGVTYAIVWMWIFNPFYGLLNWLVGLFGIPEQLWLSDPNLAMPSLIFKAIIGGGGGSIIFITAAMGGIPTELYDAAKIDGASEFTRFFRVTIPLLRPILLYLLVTGFIGAFQVFNEIWLMTRGGPGYPGSTETVGYLIYSTAFLSANFGGAAAQSLVLFAIILVFSLSQFRMFSADVEF
jgi:multiple sugar transport system permease protein